VYSVTDVLFSVPLTPQIGSHGIPHASVVSHDPSSSLASPAASRFVSCRRAHQQQVTSPPASTPKSPQRRSTTRSHATRARQQRTTHATRRSRVLNEERACCALFFLARRRNADNNDADNSSINQTQPPNTHTISRNPDCRYYHFQSISVSEGSFRI